MPQRPSELKFVDPNMQSEVLKRRQDMLMHTSIGQPQKQGFLPDQGQSFNSVIGNQKGLLGPKSLQMQSPSQQMDSISNAPIAEQPKSMDLNHVDPEVKDLMGQIMDPNQRTRVFNPSFLRTLPPKHLEALAEQAKTNGEMEALDAEFDNRGYGTVVEKGAQ